jgi:tRNA A-37 threonylcarbamoyl transferase component Bud32
VLAAFAEELRGALETRGFPPEPALDKVADTPSRLAFEAALRRLNQAGHRVVLLLDEFERLGTNGKLDLNFFNALRSAAGRYQLVFVTASARPLIELTYADHSREILSSPFFNIFASAILGPLEPDAARALLRAPFGEGEAGFSPEMTARILDLVGGHPLGLQVAAFHAFESPGDLGAMERRATEELDAHFRYCWQNLSPTERELMRRLSALGPETASDTSLGMVWKSLEQKSLIAREPAGVRFAARAWAEFVARQPPLTDTAVRMADVSDLAATLMGIGPDRRALPGDVEAGSTRSQPAPPGTGSPVAPPPRLGPYELLARLGSGAAGEVFRGRHPRLDRIVAIKVLRSDLAADATFRLRFEREARLVASLRHPNIVQVFDFGEVDGLYYMVMEFVDGQDLASLIAAQGALPGGTIARVAQDLASALDHAHARDLIHRDVKASNVIVERLAAGGEGGVRAVLSDFGLSKICTGASELTANGRAVGTPAYMAPEQIKAEATVDRRADIYSLGVLLFQMYTGHLPFEGHHAMASLWGHLEMPVPDPRALNPDVPDAAAEAIRKAMAKAPTDRFDSAGELVAALVR